MKYFARFLISHPRIVGVVFGLMTCFFAYHLSQLKADFSPQNMFSVRSEAFDYYRDFVDQFGADDNFFIILVQGDDMFTPRGLAVLSELTEALEDMGSLQDTRSLTNLPEIRPDSNQGISIKPFLDPAPQTAADFSAIKERALKNSLFLGLYVSSDGTAAAVSTELITGIEEIAQIEEIVENIEALISGLQKKYPDFRIIISGIPFLRVDSIRLLIADQILFIPISFIIVLVVSYLTFRRKRPVLFIFVTVVFILVWGLGLMSFGGGEINMLTNVLPILVMIIGVADGIHLLVRYDEEVAISTVHREAVSRTVEHIGMACLFTSITTAVGFASLVASRNIALNRFGIFSAMAILTAYVVTIHLLPLLLLKWGHPGLTVDRKGLPKDPFAVLLNRCSGLVIRHPKIIYATGLAFVVFSLFGAFRTGISTNPFQFHKKTSVTFQNNLVLEKALAGIIPYSISFKGPEDLFKDPDFLSRMSLLQASLKQSPIVGKTLSLADFVQETRLAFYGGAEAADAEPLTREAVAQFLLLLSMSADGDAQLDKLVSPDYGWGSISVRCRASDSDEFFKHVQEVQTEIQALFPPQDATVTVSLTGDGVFVSESIHGLLTDMVRSIITAFVIIFALIAIEFRSLQMALISIVPNIIPVLLTYGMMGWLGVDVEMTSVVVFTLSLGIAVDDSIHFLVRFREEFRRTGSYDTAVENTFRSAGKAIVQTTLILVLGALVLTLSALPPITRFSYLTATTLTSALLADLFVLPACILIFRPRIS